MKKLLILGGAIAGFIIAALLFTFAPGWFGSSSATAQSSGEREMIIAVEDIEVIDGVETITAGEVSVKFDNPPELPDEGLAVDGVFKGQNGDTISIGTGSLNIEVSVEQVNDQEPVKAVSASHSGPLVDVVVTADTVVYLDTTEEPKPTQADLDAGEMTVPRTIIAGSLDALDEDTIVQVWGPKDGDTITAEIVVITPIR